MSNEPKISIYRVNNNLCAFSPCGELFAIAYQCHLILKKTRSFETVHSWEYSDTIEYIEWSPNARYVLCANMKKITVQIFSVDYPTWKWKLAEGSAGMERVTWSPDSGSIICTADFNVQISIWSLEDRSVTYIQNLKSTKDNNFALSPNGKTLAAITTDNGADGVEIYKTDGWRISRKLLCEKLSSIDGLSWSPNSELLCIWCSICGQTKLLVYSTISESHIGVFSPEISPTRNIDDTGTGDIHRGPRGIDKLSWIPSGQLLAIASFKETVTLLNYVTWNPILELRCDPVIKDSDYLGKVYREREIEGNSEQTEKRQMDEIIERPINIPIVGSTKFDEPTIATIDILEFSSCGRYLAVRHQVYSSTMWIWDIADDSVDHIIFKRPISGACWNPNSPRLIVFTESPYIYEWWEDRGVTKIPSPRAMTVLSGKWHPRGKILSLCGYNKTAIMPMDQ